MVSGMLSISGEHLWEKHHEDGDTSALAWALEITPDELEMTLGTYITISVTTDAFDKTLTATGHTG